MSNHAEINRKHFDSTASTYNSKYSTTINQLIAEIQSRLDWIGVDWIHEKSSGDDEDVEVPSVSSSPSKLESPARKVRLLDYACGTGLISRALLPSLSSSTGIDISTSMVQEFNALASNQGLTPSEMHAYVGDLLSSTDPHPINFEGREFWDFDIAAVGLGFHHFEDPLKAARRLAERVKVGGVLFVMDFMPHDGHGDHGQGGKEGKNRHGHGHGHENGGHGHGSDGENGKETENGKGAQHTVIHMGFSESEVRSMFEAAGVGKGFEYVVVGRGVVFGDEGKERREVFMARGTKV